MVALDDIRISGRWPFRLTAATLSANLLRRTPRASSTLSTFLRRILVCDSGLLTRELSASRLLLRHRAVIHATLLARRACVRDHVVCGALAAAFVLGYLAITVVGIGVLQDDVPGVEQAGEKAEAAEGDVDERIGGADTAFDPHYSDGQYVLVGTAAAQRRL